MKSALMKLFVAALSLNIGMSAALAETTLRMWTFLDPTKNDPRDRTLKVIIDNFEKKHPDIKIKVEPQIWHQIPDKFTLAAGAGDAPDISWINYPRLVVPISAGATVDLKPLLKGLTDEERKDFITQAPLEAGVVDGQLLAAPIFLLTNLVMYRKDLFAEQGITPDNVRSWDGFFAAAQKLTKKTGDQTDVWGMGLALSRDGAAIQPMEVALLDLQPQIFDESCKPVVATEAGVKALELQADFVRKGVTSTEAAARTTDDNQDVFMSGRQAMVVGGSSRVVANRQKATWDGSQLGVLKWPSWAGEKSGPFSMEGWFGVIWNKSPHINEAALFLDHLMSRESAALWTTMGAQVPFRKSVLALPEVQTPENGWMVETAKGWEENGIFLPSKCNAGALFGDLNEATQKVINGQATPMEALQEVERLGADRL